MKRKSFFARNWQLTLLGILIPGHQGSWQCDIQLGQGCQESVMSPPKAQVNSVNNKESDYCDFAGKDALHRWFSR